MDQYTKKEVMYEWVRYSTSTQEGRFLIPEVAANGEVQATENLICRNAITGVLGIGRVMLQSALKYPCRYHKLFGRRGVASKRAKDLVEAYESLHHFLLILLKKGVRLLHV